MSIDRFLEDHWDEYLSDLADLVTIESTEGPPLQGAPFGSGPARALDRCLRIASRLGFETEDLDGYAGEVVWDPAGAGGPGIAALAHLDVVPAGEGWTVPPFELGRRDGRLTGRGVFDDKGPALGLLYALAGLKESGFVPRGRIRLIFGTNEESGMAGIAEYRRRRPDPLYAFTPDAPFPVVQGEKGILDATLRWECAEEGPIRVLLLETGPGAFPGVVPSSCRLLLGGPEALLDAALELLPDERQEYCEVSRPEEGRAELRFIGESAPSSSPWLGINALVRAFDFLGVCGEKLLLDPSIGAVSRFVRERLGEKFHGEGFSLSDLRDESGRVTVNPAMVRTAGGRCAITVQLRYPVTAVPAAIVSALDAAVREYGGSAEVIRSSPPLHFEEDHPLLAALLSVYRECTGDITARPVMMAGGTYARAMANCAGFGPLFPGSALTAHKPDEYILEEELFSAIGIWAGALARLSML